MNASAHFPRKAIHLVWPPIGVFLVAEVILAQLAKQPLPILSEQKTWSPWLEGSARLQYMALAMLFFVYSICVILKFIFEFIRFYDSESRRRIFVVYFLCIAGATAILLPIQLGRLPGTEEILGKAAFERALSLAVQFGSDTSWNAGVFESGRNITSLVTALALACLVTGGISCVARFDDLSGSENWRFQSERLRAYIFASSGLLVVGVLYFKAWTSYPSFALGTGGEREAFVSLVNSLAMFTGVEYTIILCAYALPVAFVLSRRANRIAARILMQRDTLPSPPSPYPYSAAIAKIKEDEKLTVAAREVFQTLAALLAPFVTGTVASLTSFSA